MTPTRREACQYFIDHGNLHGTLEECLRTWPPSVSQIRNAVSVALLKGQPRHEVEKMTAGIVFGE